VTSLLVQNKYRVTTIKKRVITPVQVGLRTQPAELIANMSISLLLTK